MPRRVIAALTMSVVSSVSLVIVNKYLITNLQFPYGASLSGAEQCEGRCGFGDID